MPLGIARITQLNQRFGLRLEVIEPRHRAADGNRISGADHVAIGIDEQGIRRTVQWYLQNQKWIQTVSQKT